MQCHQICTKTQEVKFVKGYILFFWWEICIHKYCQLNRQNHPKYRLKIKINLDNQQIINPNIVWNTKVKKIIKFLYPVQNIVQKQLSKILSKNSCPKIVQKKLLKLFLTITNSTMKIMKVIRFLMVVFLFAIKFVPRGKDC